MRHDVAHTAVPANVERWLGDLAQHGIADNTRRAYNSDRRYFDAWHQQRFGTPPHLPLSESVVVTFIADALATLPPEVDQRLCADKAKARVGGHTLSTVQRRLAALHTWHLEAGVSSPCRNPSVRQLLRRAQRTLPVRTPQRSLPIRLALLQQLVATCDDDIVGRRDRALLLVGWCCGGRRRSELSALDIDDVQDQVLSIRRSKTDPYGTGFAVPIPPPARTALDGWLATHPGSGAVFRRVRRGGHLGERLDAGGVNQIIKQRIAQAGLDPSQYSAHGLRSGFMVECETAGVPLPIVMRFTGHRSADVAVGYLSGAAAQTQPVFALLKSVGW